MGVRLKRFPEYRLDFSVYSGVVTVEQVLQHFSRLDATANWLSYFDDAADLSSIDLAHFPTLKNALAAKEAERTGDEPLFCLMVNISKANEGFARFWCAYAAEDIEHAHQRAMLPSLRSACGLLELPDGARQALERAIADEARVEPSEPSFAR